MAKTMKGPALFLAQFAGNDAPFDTLKNITKWAAGLGYKGVQIPTFDARLFDVEKAYSSDTYCDEIKGICADAGVEITELSTHLQGQLVAVNPAYDTAFDAFAPCASARQPQGPPRMGGRSSHQGREDFPQARAGCLGLLHGLARLPLSLPVAATPCWAD